MHDTAAVIESLERAPALIIPLVREVRPALLKRRPEPAAWSVHEHACHLAAVHGIYFDRLQEMLTSPSPTITPHDPGAPDLLGMDLEPALATYAADRTRLVERLRLLTPEQWARTAEYPKYSHYSVFIMFRHLAVHDFLHAYRIEKLMLRREWATEYDGRSLHGPDDDTRQ